MSPCPTCHGTGRVSTHRDGLEFVDVCPACHGCVPAHDTVALVRETRAACDLVARLVRRAECDEPVSADAYADLLIAHRALTDACAKLAGAR